MIRTSKSRTGTAFATADTITIGYNDRSEVTSAVSDNIAAYNYSFAFDTIGNRNSYTASGTTTTYTANNLNQYSAITQGSTVNPTYDNDGDMLTLPQITGGTWNNTWNGENRLIETYNDTAGKKLEFLYDYKGRRVEKKVYTGSSSTSWTLSTHERFVYDGYKLIERLDGANSNAILQKFLWVGERLLSVYDTGATATYYYFADANKNIGQLMDASGNAVAKYEYSPFGKLVSSSGAYATSNPFRFSSEYHDDETGLVYYNFRYYSPELGRWLSRDPIAEAGGYNLYGILDNNIINLWDINGQDPHAIWCIYNIVDAIVKENEKQAAEEAAREEREKYGDWGDYPDETEKKNNNSDTKNKEEPQLDNGDPNEVPNSDPDGWDVLGVTKEFLDNVAKGVETGNKIVKTVTGEDVVKKIPYVEDARKVYDGATGTKVDKVLTNASNGTSFIPADVRPADGVQQFINATTNENTKPQVLNHK